MTQKHGPNRKLDDYEKAAEALLRAFNCGDNAAIKRIGERLPQARHVAYEALADFPLTLEQARTVIAREQGMKSWGELRLAIMLKQRDYGEALDEFKRRVRAGDAVKLDEWLSAHPELRETLDDPHFDFGSTALIIAKHNLDLVDVLLKHGADINAKSQWWAGDFHILELTPPEIFHALVERGAEVTVHAAAEQGWIDWLERAYAADPTVIQQRGGDGKTPLHYAANAAVVDWLLERGAEKEARDLDHEGTPLQWMIAERRFDAARQLVKGGAQVDIFAAVALGDVDLLQAALESHPHAIRARVNCEGYELTPTADGAHEYVYAFGGAGLSPHQVALQFGHVGIFEALLAQSPPDVKLLAQCAAGDAAAASKALRPIPGWLRASPMPISASCCRPPLTVRSRL